MTQTALKKIFADGLRRAIPEGDLTISQWAERYRYVSPQRSARPGRWDNAVVPFAAGIMDAVSEPDIEKVVFMKSSQVAGTEILINILCYYIHIDPSLMMYIAEQEDKARAWTNEAFDPTIAESPELRRCMFSDVSGKTTDNNQRIKRFKGGQITIAWASSPAQLSSKPARIIAFDEVDAFEPTAEGDAVRLAEARTKTFSDSRKIILVSSPRNKENSIIEREYLAGDQREFYVPCPDCDEYQTLKWSNVRWDEEDIDNAYYVCEACGCIIEHYQKADMLARGRWIAGAETERTASFKINEIYSPFTSWGMMARNFLAAKRDPNRDSLRVFINTSLGETWEEEGEKIEYADLKFNQEDYEAEVPQGVLLLTAGVDVQDDRIEVEVVGWGRDHESWSIDYIVIEGSPGLPEVWDDLTDHLTRRFEGVSRDFGIDAVAIDSGGHHTEAVYRFAAANKGRRWFAVKGASVAGNPLAAKGSLVGRNQKVRLWKVGTDTAKDEIFSFLKVAEPGPGFCHFPAGLPYDETYFKGLCSEVKKTKFVQGIAKKYWAKVSENARNEPLDLRVYATAARAILNPNYEKIAARRLNHDRIFTEPDDGAEPDDPEATPAPREAAERQTIKATGIKPQRRRIRAKNPFTGSRWK